MSSHQLTHSDLLAFVPWLLALAGGIVVCVVAIYLVRRWIGVGADDQSELNAVGWCRELYERGDVSRAEYEAMKQGVAYKVRQQVFGTPAAASTHAARRPPS